MTITKKITYAVGTALLLLTTNVQAELKNDNLKHPTYEAMLFSALNYYKGFKIDNYLNDFKKKLGNVDNGMPLDNAKLTKYIQTQTKNYKNAEFAVAISSQIGNYDHTNGTYRFKPVNPEQKFQITAQNQDYSNNKLPNNIYYSFINAYAVRDIKLSQNQTNEENSMAKSVIIFHIVGIKDSSILSEVQAKIDKIKVYQGGKLLTTLSL